MSNELTTTGGSMDEMERMAKAIADSKLFGIQTPQQALVLMALCRSEGKDPIQAVKTYHIINGKPSMRADAMLAEYQARGGKVQWGERTNDRVSAVFFHASSGDVPVTWTIADAKQAGLLQNPTWSKYPRQMLTARVISEGIRTSLPGVVSGIYTPEEVMQFDDKPTSPGAYGSSPLIEGGPVTLPEPARITSAPNPPAPAKPPMDPQLRAAIQEFVTVWNQELVPSSGIVLDKASPITNKMERESAMALWFDNDHMLEHAPDAGHYRQAAQEIRERLAQAAETAAEPAAEEVVVANPIQEGEPLDLPELEDPFAETVAPARTPSYAEQETTARRGRK